MPRSANEAVELSPIVPTDIPRMAECIELRRDEALWSVLPRDLAEKRRLESFRVGGAFVTVAANSISLQRNCVRGLGVEEVATEEALDEILSLFRARRIKRLSFHLSPCPQSTAIAGWLGKRGFRLHHQYVQLVRDTAAPQPVATEFRVRRIQKPQAEVFARVFGQVFPWPADRLSWIRAAVGAPGFSHYLAFAGNRAVATGLLYVAGGWGWLGWAGTLTPYRRLGAHAALIAARLKRAAELGAAWVACETLEPRPGRPSGSYRDLLRQGFRQAYLRPIWVWEQP